MPVYQYTARNAAGETVKASVTAASRYEALAALYGQGLTVVALEGADDSMLAAAVPARGRLAGGRHLRFGTVSLTERAVFCRQLAISVSSGISLREALESIAADAEHDRLAGILNEVIRGLHAGQTFSQAIASQGQVFNRLFVALIRAAEEAGTMAETLNYLATTLEKSDRLARKVRSITAYPMFVLVIFCVACTVMTVFVLPRFQSVFGSFHAQLPLLTRMVLRVNGFIISHTAVILVTLLALVGALVAYGRTASGRMTIDRLKLRLPFFGSILRKMAVARFCRNLGVMIRGGVPVASAIEIGSEALGNQVMEQALAASRERIMAGSDIASSLDRKIFPKLVIRMVGVGESSGRLPEVLEKVSDMYDDQIEGSIMVATSLFEPLIICAFGAVILILVMAIYLPVFTMASAMK
jgi:type IV pilus assembly protein PilC